MPKYNVKADKIGFKDIVYARNKVEAVESFCKKTGLKTNEHSFNVKEVFELRKIGEWVFG